MSIPPIVAKQGAGLGEEDKKATAAAPAAVTVFFHLFLLQNEIQKHLGLKTIDDLKKREQLKNLKQSKK